jgi:L1 cell adhesion molecule like protein
LNEDLFHSTIEPVERCLRDAKIEKSQIHDIVLVGGSSRIPKVQKLLQDFFNGKTLNNSINPDEAVAYGAAVQAAILVGDESEELQDLLLLDVTPLSLGTALFREGMTVLITRNTSIPTKQTQLFTTMYDNQPGLVIHVYECERKMTNKLLGIFELRGIPPAPSGVPKIEVTFEIDANGILNVTAVEKSTGKENNVTVINDSSRPSKDGIERKLIDVGYLAEDEKLKQTMSVRENLMAYCFSMESAVEDEELKGNISTSDKNTILCKCKEVIFWLTTNERAENEEYESQLEKLESLCKPIMTKTYQVAVSIPGT